MKRNLNLLLASIFIISSCTQVENQTSNDSKEELSESPEEISSSTNEENLSTVEESSTHDTVEESMSSLIDDSVESNEESIDSSLEDSSEESESSIKSTEETKPSVVRETKDMSYYLGKDGDVYRMNINTDDGTFPQNKNDYIQGSISITDQSKEEVLLPSSTMGIKLRGNSTLEGKKKPFKIKFDKKQSLFGLKKAKKWVLLANYFDKTNVRNYLAYLMGRKMTNLSFQPSSIFVDVYFNDQYYGLFLLTEQMEAKEGRVEVEDIKNSDGIDSFFFEADARAADELRGLEDKAWFRVGNYVMAPKYPDPDDYVEAQGNLESEDEAVRTKAQEFITQFEKDTQWLKAFTTSALDAVHTHTAYDKYIDVESFIDYYLIEEFFKNVDVGSTSQYYYIDQGEENPVIHAGPVWDFDISSGVTGNPNPYYTYINTPLFVRERDQFTKYLFRDASFSERVRIRYNQLREEVFLGVFNDLANIKEILSVAQERNLNRWPLTYYVKEAWIEQYAYGDDYCALPDLNAHYDHLENFLRERLALLDDVYGW